MRRREGGVERHCGRRRGESADQQALELQPPMPPPPASTPLALRHHETTVLPVRVSAETAGVRSGNLDISCPKEAEVGVAEVQAFKTKSGTHGSCIATTAALTTRSNRLRGSRPGRRRRSTR